jgi:hypothetical protein
VWSVLVTFSFSTGQYGHYWPVNGAIKLFLATMFFYGLHINTAYHSYLINVLTNPRYDEQIDTVEKAIDGGLKFEVGDNVIEFLEEKKDAVRLLIAGILLNLISLHQASAHLIKNHVKCDKLDECFRTIATDRTKVLAISRAHASNNPYSLIENVDFYCFPVSDDIVIYSSVMMFRKFFHLLPVINEKIRVIAESGLLAKWQLDSKNSATKQNKVEVSSDSEGNGGKQMKLRLEHGRI